MAMHPSKKAQIKAQIRALIFDEVSTPIIAEYSNYSKDFLVKNTTKLAKNTGINKCIIKLEKSK